MLPVPVLHRISLFIQSVLEKTKVIRVSRRNRVFLCEVNLLTISASMLDKAKFVVYFFGRQFAVEAIVFGHACALEVLIHSCEQLLFQEIDFLQAFEKLLAFVLVISQHVVFSDIQARGSGIVRS